MKRQFDFKLKNKINPGLRILGLIFMFLVISGNSIVAKENDADVKKASVTGVIQDPNGTLPGASIVIKGTTTGSVSNAVGEFQITGLKTGNYTLVISFIGYDEKEINVDVKEGSNTNLGNIDLSESSTAITEVMVKGRFFPSQVRALNMKKTSLGIMEVLASDAIGKLPDRNAAEAVQRMQGVSIERDHGEGRYVIVRGTPLAWNSTLLNGNRMPSSEGTSNDAGGRTSPLDIFPSEMIQYVQLSKALTPDMEGDAIGGSVNFITKTAPHKRTLNVNLGYGNNMQAQKPIQSASILYGDRTKDGKFGFLVSGSYWNRNWGTDNYEVEYDESNFALQTLELRDYLGERRTYGFNAGMEYNFSDNNKVYARGMYTDFQDDETAAEHTFSFADEEFVYRRRRGITGINLLGGELGGNFSTIDNRLQIDLKLSQYSVEMETRKLPNTSRTASPVYQMVMFAQPMTFNNLAPDGNKYLDIDAPSGYTGDHYDNIQPNPASTLSNNSLTLDMLYGFEMASFERDRNAQTDFTFDVNQKVKIKAGYKYKRKYLERGAPAYIDINMPAYGMGVNLTAADLETMPFPANGGYLSEIDEPYNNLLLDPITLKEVDYLFGDEFQKNPFYEVVNDETNPSSAPSFFDGYETVNALYGMAEIDVNSKLKLIAGARYEHTGIEYDGYSVITNEDESQDIVELENSADFDAFLPMVHLKYSPVEKANIRLAYTRSFARANFTDLNPTESRNLIFNTISRGNINLKPTFSNNFDLMGEYFFDNLSLLSGGVFYKSLDNVIYTGRSITTVDGNRYEVYQPENSENGWLFGFELGFSRRFTNLPGFLSGFGLEGNYTFTDSEMDVPEYSVTESGNVVKTVTTEKLPNQSKNIFNLGLFYEKNNISFRLAGNYKGESLAVVQGNPENYRWYDKNFTMDFTASYNISERIKVYAEINNLTNAPLRYYQGVSERPEQTEYYGIRGLVGVNVNIF